MNTSMKPTVTPEQALAEFRRILPAASGTARAIDRGERWEQTALNAVSDGYINEAEELRQFIEACLKKGILHEV